MTQPFKKPPPPYIKLLCFRERIGIKGTHNKITNFRSSPSEIFLGKDVLKIYRNLQENTHAEV